MKISEVKNLSPEERFLYWIRERHAVYERRKQDLPKPWTDDEVLQRYFFTNPYRENDKVTVWFRENVREPLRNDQRVLFATIAFRWFNLPSTGAVLIGNRQPLRAQGRLINPNGNLLVDWHTQRAIRRLNVLKDRGDKIFTGAFMIVGPKGRSKVEAICERIDTVWEDLDDLECRASEWDTLEQAQHDLLRYDGLGGFMAYEIVCDLRYTMFLEDASDKLTWCNPGPGAVRGLYRVAGEPFNSSGSDKLPKPKDWLQRMTSLLKLCQTELADMPPFEMREIEHSLCEFDKYCRALAGDGHMRRLYQGI